ncbi:MAG: prepilin-type N-terminal cleavage/methylation domain-containing protein [Candidatus Kuenenia sp.]|nr:prepilin-type N-terminal cleavage/methylation domain-containing protein [Candidatus Kuenenia hertensis]
MINNNEQGFTLIELVVGLVLMVIILSIAVKLLILQRKTFNVQEQVSEMQQYIRSSMDAISREARMAGYNPTGASFNGINVAQTGTFTFSMDNDGNGTITASESITYAYDSANSQIDRNANDGNGALPFAENIDNLTFLYYDGDGATTATLSDIRKIKITITGRTENIDPISGEYKYATLTSFVTPKNLDY